MTAKTQDDLEAIRQERGKIYGDPFLSHEAIGLAWEGVVRNRYQGQLSLACIPTGQLFPASLVALMLAAFKNVRASRPVLHQDSFDDEKVYADFAWEFLHFELASKE